MFFTIIKKEKDGKYLGHIEEGENWQDVAKREMYEETGATKVEFTSISVYKISLYVLLCYCKILEMANLPDEYEMDRIMFSDTLPDNLMYPDAFELYFDTVNEKIVK